MFENISKEDKLKYGALALIALFVLSMMAMYWRTPDNGTGPQAPDATGAGSFQFSARENLTLVGWDPVVMVSGRTPQLDALVAQLESEGVVTRDISVGEGVILRLDDARSVFNVSARVSALGLQPYSDAYVSIPSIDAQNNGVNVTVQGNSFRQQLPVVFEDGDVIVAQFAASSVAGKLFSIGSLQLEYGPETGARVVPDNVSDEELFYRVNVPWEQRNLDAAILDVKMIGGSRTNYKPRTYVEFADGLSDAQINTLNAKLPPYVTNIGRNLAGIRPDMTNKSRVAADMKALVGVEPAFPPSPLDIHPYRRANGTESDAVRMVRESWMAAFPSIGAVLVPTWRLNVTLPATMQVQGKTYIISNRTLEMNSLYPPTANGTVRLAFRPLGRLAGSFSGAQFDVPQNGTEAAPDAQYVIEARAPAPPSGAKPGGNGTAANESAPGK